MVRREYEAVGVIQVHGQLTGPFALGEFVAPSRGTFRGPEVLQALSGPEFIHADTNLSGPLLAMHLLELRALIERFGKLFRLEGYIPSNLKINTN
jgi:hypothetical protein